MPRCALVGSVDFNEQHFLAASYDMVIAVDGGLRWLDNIGCTPDIVLGDFDSLGYVPAQGNVMCFPAEKDASDMELAISCARDAGCDDLVFYGALSGRLDHTLANLALMAHCAHDGCKVRGVGDAFAVAALCGGDASCLSFRAFDPAALDGSPYGRFISVFACGGDAYGVCEEGLKYRLDNAVLAHDASLGLSNEFTGQPVRITVEQGTLLAVFPLGAYDALSFSSVSR